MEYIHITTNQISHSVPRNKQTAYFPNSNWGKKSLQIQNILLHSRVHHPETALGFPKGMKVWKKKKEKVTT